MLSNEDGTKTLCYKKLWYGGNYCGMAVNNCGCSLFQQQKVNLTGLVSLLTTKMSKHPNLPKKR
jgi:hypothetical protein